jgi:hypothetical protein
MQTPQEQWVGERVLDGVREIFCGLHGHDHLLQFEQGRLFLRCLSCGHQSRGWELNETPPTITAHRDNRRLAIARPQLIGVRPAA